MKNDDDFISNRPEFGSDLGRARDEIRAELVSQRENTLLVVEAAAGMDADTGRCFWQLTAVTAAQVATEGGLYFLMLMDPAALDPKERTVSLRPKGTHRVATEGGLYFLMLMDPAALDPKERTVSLRLGENSRGVSFDVFDQFGSQTSPPGTLGDTSTVPVTIHAGTVRFLTVSSVHPQDSGGSPP